MWGEGSGQVGLCHIPSPLRQNQLSICLFMLQIRFTLKKFLSMKNTPAAPGENSGPKKERKGVMGLGVQTKRRLLLHKTPYLYLQPAIPRNARPLSPLPGPQRPLEAVLAPNTAV